MKSKIAILDCNNFYVSCERLFNPKLQNIPVVVLSNNDGCVISRSNEAKKLGIKMGQPAFEIEAECEKHGIVQLSTNFALYSDISNRVMKIIKDEMSSVEIYSVDEAFFDLSETIEGTERDICIKLRQKIQKWVGIPVTIGIAPSKTLAKALSKIAKKNAEFENVISSFEMSEDEIDTYLEKIDISDVWGVGFSYTKLLRLYGINTAKDFKYYSSDWINSKMKRPGLWIQKELNSTKIYSVDNHPKPKKSISVTRTFGKSTTDINVIKEAISSFAERATEKLISEKVHTNAISIFLHTSRFAKERSRYLPSGIVFLPSYTDDPSVICKSALMCVEKLFKGKYTYKRCGITLLNLIPNSFEQKDFFVNEEVITKLHQKYSAIEKVNKKYGSNTIRLASSGFSRQWKSNQQKITKRYTTSWEELLEISL